MIHPHFHFRFQTSRPWVVDHEIGDPLHLEDLDVKSYALTYDRNIKLNSRKMLDVAFGMKVETYEVSDAIAYHTMKLTSNLMYSQTQTLWPAFFATSFTSM